MPSKVGLDKTKAIRIETEHRKKYGPRYTYVFKCDNITCTKETQVRGDALKSHSGFCTMHAHTKRPFESIWSSIGRGGKGRIERPSSLTYEEFLEFTHIKTCDYCGGAIPWQAYGTIMGKYTSRAYFLDRKKNDEGYSKQNCVVCCSNCNLIKREHFTYEEMKAAMKAVMLLRRKA